MTWPMVKLKNCCTIVGGATPRRDEKSFWNSPDIPWVTPKDISNLKNKIINDAPEYISQLGFDKSATFMLPQGSVLLTSRAPIGNLAITGKPMCTNQGFKSLVPNPDVDCTYLYYCMLANIEKLQALGNGATFKEVSKKIVEDFEIPLPPLVEQKRIAAILDKADAIRQKRQQAIALADQFLRSVFLDMFVNSSNEAWDIKSIEYIADPKNGGLRTGPFGSQLLHSEFVESGISVLGIDNAVENQFKWGKPRFITEEKYQTLIRYTVHPEDVLITIMGTCGRCAVVPCDIPKAINTKHLCCITLDKKKALPEFLHSYYLFHPMSQRYLAQKTKGAIMDGLNMGIIKEMPFPMVPLELQERFVSIKNATISSVGKQHLLEENQQLLFNVLSKKAFSGQL